MKSRRTRKRCLEDTRLADAAFDAEVLGAKDDARVVGQLETLKPNRGKQ